MAFYSQATNLVSGDTGGYVDIFVRDRVLGTTDGQAGSGGTQGNGNSYWPSISADGRYVAFESAATNLVSGDSNAVPDIFVRDLIAGTTSRVSVSSAGPRRRGKPPTLDQRRRPLCGLHLRGDQSRERRCQWQDRHLRPRPDRRQHREA